jgi:SH3-like domain-containing protein
MYGETFKLEVAASDENLYELEVDHNIAELPEFSVYASESDPYGGQGEAFAEAGVTVTYNAAEQKWIIDFGKAVTTKIVEKGGITFYLVLVDDAGNKWGSMDPTTPENTFAYNVTQDEAPEVSTYKFSYEVPGGIVAGEEVEVDVTFATVEEGDYGYEGVRFKFAAQGPEGATVTFKAVDSNNVEHSFTNEGYWGPPGGFDLPAAYSAKTDWTLVFSKAGDYTITFSLIDADTEEVIAGITDSATVEVGAAPEVKGSIERDPANTGGELEVTIENDTVTFTSGEIKWYPEDKDLGRAAGNRVGVQINAPADFDTTGVTVKIGEQTYNWDEIKDGDGYFWWYPLVTQAGQQFTATVVWNESSTQEFKVVIGEGVTLEAAPDTTDPELKSVSPKAGDVNLEYGETFKLEVAASDENLYELEVDHNIAELPEFSVYASESDPYGGQGEAFAEAGVTVTYNAAEQKWIIDFGKAVTTKIVEKGGITFYLVLVDDAGNKWGSMDPTTPENTFAYNVTQDEAPEVSTYKFSYEVPGGIVAGEEVEVDVTFATVEEGDYGYEGVRFKFAAQGPEGATVTFKAVDSNNVEHSFTNEGYWGPADGFDIPAEYTATTDWTLVFSKAGQYTITFSLIDADTEEVIAGITDSATVEVGAAPEVKGSIERDPANTGGELEVTIENDTVTFTSGEIKWYPEDKDLGRAAGNRVGVQINAPADFDTTGVTVKIGEQTYNWDEIKDGDGYFWWYPLVTQAGQQFTATVVWNESSTQEFKVVIGEGVTLEAAPDTTDPELKSVSPKAGDVNLEYGETFKLEVAASDENLYELEVDHNIADLPEFSVYASEEDPYGGQEEAFAAQGVTVTYNTEEQKWTIDFGEEVTDQIVAKGGITFYLVIKDQAGNQWGSMYEVTEENTFKYNVTQDVVPDEAQFVWDVNRIEGEGNMSEKLSELGNTAYEALEAVQKVEVAKLFILNRPDEGFADIAAIEIALGEAIDQYNSLLDAVNDSGTVEAMRTALEAIGTLFGINVTDLMAQAALDAKGDGYENVSEIIAVIQDSIANVGTLEEFKAALADASKTLINLTADFTTTEKILVSRDGVTINGNNKTITFTGDETGWQGNYVLHVYKATGVTIKDIKLTGGDAALLVNGSEVTLEGAIDVSGNEFGGIESSKGVGVEKDPKLTVTDATFTNTTEAYGLPTIWEDQIKETVVAADEQFTVNEEVREGQVQYYLDAENAVDPNAHIANVKDLEEFKAALADASKTVINLTADFTTTEKILVSRDGVTINGNNKTITFTGDEKAGKATTSSMSTRRLESPSRTLN